MVGFSPDKKELPSTAYVAAGAISGVFTRSFAQPLDVLKIRFQVHVKPIGNYSSSKYQGILHAFCKIYNEEGIKAFWKGHVPAQVLSIVFGVAQFAAFEFLTKQVWAHLPPYLTTDLRPATHFVCGGLAGSLATLACQPFDVIRTRFVTQGEPKVYTSIFHGCECMIKQEGFRAFYKGLVPTLLQVTPQTALQFGSYTLLTKLWKGVIVPHGGMHHRGNLETLVCGSGSGFISKLIIYPLDMIKKRLQVQGFEKGWSGIGETRKYEGLIDCGRCVLKEEGFCGLYKGLSPALLKAMVASAVCFWSYEQTINIIRIIYNEKSEKG